MREGIGGVQLFLIVVILVLIFSGIMSLTMNHANAFAVKDQIVSIIEDAGGLDLTASCNGGCNTFKKNELTLQKIVDALESSSYRQKGSCENIENSLNEKIENKATVAGYQRNGDFTVSGKKSSFCIAKIPANDGDNSSLKGYYYKVYVFYELDIPIINSIFNFSVMGETKLLYV